MLKFEFDPWKAKTNLRKHSVSFDEAITAFGDKLCIVLDDDLHSDFEQRFIRLATSSRDRLLVIIYTESDSTVRLISARVATATERFQYEEIG